MPLTWRPVNVADKEAYCMALQEFRDVFLTSLGPLGHFKLFVPSADGAPPICTSTSDRILASLQGLLIYVLGLTLIKI